MESTGLAYARFMDDWVILAPTRWKLREAIRLVNQTLAELHVEQHPDKTFIGRISRGFDILGYAFTPAGLKRPCRQSNGTSNGCPGFMSAVSTCATSGPTSDAGCSGPGEVSEHWVGDCPSGLWNSSDAHAVS